MWLLQYFAWWERSLTWCSTTSWRCSEIAFRQAITVNSVKSYIRSTYHKLGVTSRAQAVSWGLQHGFEPRDQDSPVLEENRPHVGR